MADRTPNSKRRRKQKTKSTPHKTPPVFEEDSDNSEKSPVKMADGEDEPTLKQMFKVLMELKTSQDHLGEKFDRFEDRMNQLTADSIAAKKDITNLQQVDQQQQQQIDYLAIHIEEIEQRSVNNDLVFSGLPNLEHIPTETVLKRICELYGFVMQHISKYETISGISKLSKKPFNMVFVTLVTNTLKQHILNKQKELGPIMWDQLLAEVPENLKMNKIYIKTRLTPKKQLILNECKIFSKQNKIQIPFAWASKHNGKIFLKELGVEKPIIINSIQDLDNVKRKYRGP
jgi:hypothetical protein